MRRIVFWTLATLGVAGYGTVAAGWVPYTVVGVLVLAICAVPAVWGLVAACTPPSRSPRP